MPGTTVADYLIGQLVERGVRHVFGVPGDFVLGFMDRLSRSRLTLINTCDEQGAGFAADAYARMTGLGVVCVTYGLGLLVETEGDLEAALAEAERRTDELVLIEVRLDPRDASPTLRRIAEGLR